MIPNRASWLRHFAAKLRLPEALIERAFTGELSEDRPVDAPLEIPDIIEIQYKYSYGQTSRFFREIRDNQRLYGTKCTSCGKVYLPPRANCGECYASTEWVPLGNSGTVESFTTVYFATSAFFDKTPFICALIHLDGAGTCFMQNVFMKDVTKAKVGMRVKAVFKEERLGDAGDFYFVPEEE